MLRLFSLMFMLCLSLCPHVIRTLILCFTTTTDPCQELFFWNSDCRLLLLQEGIGYLLFYVKLLHEIARTGRARKSSAMCELYQRQVSQRCPSCADCFEGFGFLLFHGI